MTFEPSDPVAPTVTTSRVGSGRSARLMALVVAGVLIGVVGYAYVNRPLPQAAALVSTTPEPLLTPTPARTPSPPRNQIVRIDFEPRDYRYDVLMEITGGTLRAALEPKLSEVHTGSVVIESFDVGDVLVVEVGRHWTDGGLTIFESFGSWPVDLEPLRTARAGRVELLVAHEPPGPAPGPPGGTADGYTFTVLGRRDGSRLKLSMELVWPRYTA